MPRRSCCHLDTQIIWGKAHASGGVVTLLAARSGYDERVRAQPQRLPNPGVLLILCAALAIVGGCGDSGSSASAAGGGPRAQRRHSDGGAGDAGTGGPGRELDGSTATTPDPDAGVTPDAGNGGDCPRGDCAPPPPACDAAVCAVLLGLEPSLSTLRPAFDPAVTEYALDLGIAPSTFTLTPTVDGEASVAIDGVAVASGSASSPLSSPAQVGATVDIELVVRAGDQTASYVVHARRTWHRVLHAKASNADASDRFGSSVAISGDVVVVGAPEEASSAEGVDGDQASEDATRSGAAYVFRRTQTGWEQEAYLKASNTDQGDGFGTSVAVSGDVVVVGAPSERSKALLVDGDEDDDSLISPGAAYVFRRVGGAWQQDAYLKASNTEEGDSFGGSVAISGDVIVVGAEQEDSNAKLVDGDDASDAEPQSGAAYVYRYAASAWQLDAYLKASNTGADDAFGHRVAISDDVIVVSAPGERSSATLVDGDDADDAAFDSGAAYVYRRVSNSWQLDAYLKASNTDAEDAFGSAVAIAGDVIVVGADQEDSAATTVDGDGEDDTASASGAAYVYRYDGGNWQHAAYLKALNAAAGDRFGTSVAVTGELIAVGAHSEAGGGIEVDPLVDDRAPNAGAVYVFREVDGVYAQEAYVKGPGPALEAARFGAAIALDGDRLLVGARDDSGGGMGVDPASTETGIAASGAVYVYE